MVDLVVAVALMVEVLMEGEALMVVVLEMDICHVAEVLAIEVVGVVIHKRVVAMLKVALEEEEVEETNLEDLVAEEEDMDHSHLGNFGVTKVKSRKFLHSIFQQRNWLNYEEEYVYSIKYVLSLNFFGTKL